MGQPNHTARLASSLLPASLLLAFLWMAHTWRVRLSSVVETPGYDLPAILGYVFGTLIWLTAGFLFARAFVLLILNPMIRGRTGNDAPAILANLIHALAFLVSVLLIVKFVFDRPIGGIVATSGLLTLVIGFAIRDMIADFFSGLAMNIERPYAIGDWLELEPGLIGRVVEMNWRSTRLLTLSSKTVVVPNNNLASRQFLNYSVPDNSYRSSLRITLNFTTDTVRAENILTASLLATDCLVPGARHNVRIRELSERGVVYELRFWVSDHSKNVEACHQVASHVLHNLHQAGIAIPYGQQEVLLTRERRPRQEQRINTKRLLSRMDLLAPLNDEELTQLARVATAHDFTAGETILNSGEDGVSLYLLVEGVAEAITAAEDKRQRLVKIEPGQAMGEMSVLTGAPRVAEVRAITDVHALSLTRDDLQPLFRARPEIADDLAQVMIKRMRENAAFDAKESTGQHRIENLSKARQLAQKISSFFSLSA